MSKCTFTLCNFIFMMNWYMVNSSRMNIKIFSKKSSAHCWTFNMPTRVRFSPRTIPFHYMIFRCLYPKCKVKRISLFFVNFYSCTCLLPFNRIVWKNRVFIKFWNIKINSLACFISISIFYYFFNHLNHLWYIISSFCNYLRLFNM